MDNPKRIKVDLSDLTMTGEERAILAPYFASTQANADGWIKMHCPIHGDANPSAGVNVYTSWWRCQACGEGGTIGQLIRRQAEWKPPDHERIIGEDPEWEPSTASRPLPTESLPRVKDLEALSVKLLTRFAQPLEYLATERGIDPQTIERFKIGYRLRQQGGEYVLPMWHEGALVNVRYYSRTRNPKVLNHTGYGSIGLFPDSDIPSGAKLVIVEGEWDCYATMQRLEKYGYTVRTFTNGTGGIRQLRIGNPAIVRILASEPAEIITILDCDEAGRKAAAHIARLLPDARDVVLPYEITADNGKDLSDYWQERRGRTDEAERQLLDMMTNGNGRSPNGRSLVLPDVTPRRPGKRQGTAVSTPIRPARRPRRVLPGPGTLPATGIPAQSCESLHAALHDPKYDGQVIKLSSIEVLGFAEQRHVLITEGQVSGCKRKAMQHQCNSCPLTGEESPPSWSIRLDDDLTLVEDLLGRSQEEQFTKIHKYLQLCGHAVSKRTDTVTYHDMAIKERGQNDNVLVRCMYLLQLKITPPKLYDLTCIVAAKGSDLTKTLLVIDAVETVHAIPKRPVDLQRPAPGLRGPGLTSWIEDTAEHLALNKTGVFGLNHLHVALTLMFTSALKFIGGEHLHRETRGSLDVAIIGATRTGKTTAVKEIAKAHGLTGPSLDDAMVSGENVSTAGLLAGLEHVQGQRIAIAGAFPRNHRGWVFLDEQQELIKSPATKKLMGALNTVRDTGRVSVKKIMSVDYQAELRFGVILNPPDDMKARPIEALLESYGSPAERSRIDLVVAVDSVSAAEQRQIEEDLRSRADMPHMPEEQRKWLAWFASNVKPEDVVIPKGGDFVQLLDDYCDEYAETYAPEYDPIGVMHPQTNRDRLVRVATSIATHTMSLDAAYEKVLVKKVHLECAKMFIDRLNRESGYFDLVTEHRAEYELRSIAIRNAVRTLTRSASQTPIAKRQAKAFAARWNDTGFTFDTSSRSQWKDIEHIIVRFIEERIMVPVKTGSNLHKMVPEFRAALGAALKGEE